MQAGGWLARVFLLDFGTAGIDRLVTLGSPHLPPPPGVIDQTRGILTYVADACPGCHHNEVCIPLHRHLPLQSAGCRMHACCQLC